MSNIPYLQLRGAISQVAEFVALSPPAEGGAAALPPNERLIHLTAEVFSQFIGSGRRHPLPDTWFKSILPSDVRDIMLSCLNHEEKDRLLSIQGVQGIQKERILNVSIKRTFTYTACLQISNTDPRSWQPISSFLAEGTTFEEIQNRLKQPTNQLTLAISDLNDAQLEWVFAFLEQHDLLKNVYHLTIAHCPHLRSIPHLRFPNLRTFKLWSCDALLALPDLHQLTQLHEFAVSFCTALRILPSLDQLIQLRHLTLLACGALSALPSLAQLVQLHTLKIHHCNALESLTNLDRLHVLRNLDIFACARLPIFNSIEDYRNHLQRQQRQPELHPNNLSWIQRFFGLLVKSVTSVWDFFTGLGRPLFSWLRSCFSRVAA